MSDKDIIIRVSGTNKKAEEFLEQVLEEVEVLGLLPESKTVKAVPSKVSKSEVKVTKAKDIKISVVGDETKVETFLDAVIESITESTNLPSPSVNLKLESPKDEPSTPE